MSRPCIHTSRWVQFSTQGLFLCGWRCIYLSLPISFFGNIFVCAILDAIWVTLHPSHDIKAFLVFELSPLLQFTSVDKDVDRHSLFWQKNIISDYMPFNSNPFLLLLLQQCLIIFFIFWGVSSEKEYGNHSILWPVEGPWAKSSINTAHETGLQWSNVRQLTGCHKWETIKAGQADDPSLYSYVWAEQISMSTAPIEGNRNPLKVSLQRAIKT